MQGSITLYASIAGIQASGIITRSANGGIAQNPELPAGKAGTQTAWTDANTFSITAPGHTLVGGDKVMVFWSESGAPKMHHNATVGVVAGDVVPLDLGSGDNMPYSPGLAVVITKEVSIDVDFDGDLLQLIAVTALNRVGVRFVDSGSATLKAVDNPAGELWKWAKNAGEANPLTGNPVDSIKAANGQSDAATTCNIAGLYDSVM